MAGFLAEALVGALVGAFAGALAGALAGGLTGAGALLASAVASAASTCSTAQAAPASKAELFQPLDPWLCPPRGSRANPREVQARSIQSNQLMQSITGTRQVCKYSNAYSPGFCQRLACPRHLAPSLVRILRHQGSGLLIVSTIPCRASRKLAQRPSWQLVLLELQTPPKKFFSSM